MNASTENLHAAAWPQARASQALLALARAARLAPRESALHELASDEGADTLGERLAATAEECDLELEEVETPYASAAELVTRGAPALLRLEDGGETRLLALLTSGPRPVVLDPNGTRRRTTAEAVRSLWCAPYELALDPQVTPVLDAAGIQGARRGRARAALIGEHLGAVPVGGAWVLRLPPGRPLREQARHARLGRLALGVAACGFAGSMLALLSWIPLGRGVLSGRLEWPWLLAWALLLASALPLRWLEGWLQSLFGVRFAILFRRRLMCGATRLEPEAVRGEGAGRLLARVLDSEALEALLLGGGFVLVGAVLDVALATWVLSHGPAPWLSLALFALLLAVVLVLGVRHVRRTAAQADARLGMTHDLVERMQGQRTRVVQEPRERWHLEEDALLERYLARSRALDRSTLALLVVTGGGWLVLGTTALALAFVAGAVPTVQLALGIGAILLGQGALARVGSGLVQLSACVVAWRQVRAIWAAADRREDPGLPRAALRPALRAEGPATRAAASERRASEALVAARGLRFRHAGREEEVLAGADFTLHAGDGVLLEGPSGGGKSTLVSLLAGWRTPRAGSLLLDGLDRASHGAQRWRRSVAVAPQFHENHVFTGTLAFNLLLAAPPEPAPPAGSFTAVPGAVRAEERAREVCAELGLGDLVERMPSGMRQVVGETGWQLSHGEKSRVFLARALLADARLVVLDESLAALDPVTAREVLACVRRRAPALLVVAHP
jgi:ATP-binding cassette subfamily B protein